MSMFLLEGSNHRSCNLASECTHVCWLVWVGVCVCVCVRSCVLVSMCRQTAGVQKRAPLPPEPSKVRSCHGFAALETKSDDPSHTEPRGSKSARRYCQSPVEYPATVSRPSKPTVTTLPHKTAGVQKRAPLPPEPSKGRLCHGFAPLETKSDDFSTQNRAGPKARRARAPWITLPRFRAPRDQK